MELFRHLREQRVRTISTVLGITWGTLSVVLLMAFGFGLETMMQERARGLGTGIGIVWARQTTQPFQGLAPGRRLRLKERDVLDLPKLIPEIELISPEYHDWDTIEARGHVLRVALVGVHPEFGMLRTLEPEPGGRFIDALDIDGRRRAAFLGDAVRDRIFPRENAVGKTIILRGAPFTVVGVMQPKRQDSDYGGHDTNKVFLPATTHAQLYNRRYVSNFVFRARDNSVHDYAIDRIHGVLGSRYQFSPQDRGALNIWDTTEEARLQRYIFLGFQIMLVGSGALTLVVGGIGAANLMYILVRQRTHEIGVLMALGARPQWILSRVLGEAFVLVGMGGVVGIVMAWLIVLGVNATPLTENIGRAEISPPVAGFAAALLAVVALLAGYYPARRASRLNPVDALAEEG